MSATQTTEQTSERRASRGSRAKAEKPSDGNNNLKVIDTENLDGAPEDGTGNEYTDHVMGAYEAVKTEARAAVNGEQKTDDLRRSLGQAVYHFFYALFTDDEITAMRNDVANNGTMHFPKRVVEVLDQNDIKRPHFRSHNPISAIYAQAYFEAKVELANKLNRLDHQGKNKKNAVPFGVNLLLEEEIAFWDRDEIPAKAGDIPLKQPVKSQQQSDEAIAGDIYRYARLTFIAIDTSNESVFKMSFRNANEFWDTQRKNANFKSLGLPTNPKATSTRAPRQPGTKQPASAPASAGSPASTTSRSQDEITADMERARRVPDHIKHAGEVPAANGGAASAPSEPPQGDGKQEPTTDTKHEAAPQDDGKQEPATDTKHEAAPQGDGLPAAPATSNLPAVIRYEVISAVAPMEVKVENPEWMEAQPEVSYHMVMVTKTENGVFARLVKAIEETA